MKLSVKYIDEEKKKLKRRQKDFSCDKPIYTLRSRLLWSERVRILLSNLTLKSSIKVKLETYFVIKRECIRMNAQKWDY